MTKTYDVKSYELAQHFLGDRDGISQEQIIELAREIQTTVEDFMAHVPDPGAHQVDVQ